MTEGEFQEFLITVGYRYNTKAKSAFNTFEGFRTIVEFNEKENRYTFFLAAGVKDIAALQSKLKQFASKNKEFNISAVYRDKRIRINVKMTIDSDIDREHLKEVTRFISSIQKSELIYPICRICSRNRKTGLYVVGRELVPMCDNCLTRKRRQYERRRDKFEKKKQNMPGGIAGAVFGAAAGAWVYILLYQFFSGFGVTSALIAFLCFAGFVVAGRRATRKSAVICMIIAVFAFAAAEYMALVASMAVLIEREGGGIAVSEAIFATNMSFKDQNYLMSILIESGIGIGVMIVVGIAYFLKRKYTRPLKISKNIL